VLGHDFQTALQRRIAYRLKSSDDRYQIRGMTITHAVAYQCLQESRLSRSGVVDNTSMHLIQTPWTHVLLSTEDSPVVQVLEFALLMLVDRRTASVLMRDSGLGDLMSLVSTKADTAMMTFKAFKTAATPLLKPYLLPGGRLPNSAAHHFALEWWDHLTSLKLVKLLYQLALAAVPEDLPAQRWCFSMSKLLTPVAGAGAEKAQWTECMGFHLFILCHKFGLGPSFDVPGVLLNRLIHEDSKSTPVLLEVRKLLTGSGSHTVADGLASLRTHLSYAVHYVVEHHALDPLANVLCPPYGQANTESALAVASTIDDIQLLLIAACALFREYKQVHNTLFEIPRPDGGEAEGGDMEEEEKKEEKEEEEEEEEEEFRGISRKGG
jgi:hypothetical protein